MNDFEEMLKLYPEMILMSKNPHSWKGLITISDYKESKMKVKVKVVIPSFPQLHDTKIYFGSSIAPLFGTVFKNHIESVIKRSESVPHLFQELILVIKNLINCGHEHEECKSIIKRDIIEKLLKELSNVLSEQSDVEFSSTKDLSTIKLTMNDISVIVKPAVTSTGQNSWAVVSSDLPELCNYCTNKKKSFSLKEIRNVFQKQVNLMEGIWKQLRKIDSFCWITDPICPKPYHLHRRIYLSSSLSLLITLSSRDPTGFPKIRFLGAASEVEKYRDIIQDLDVIKKWNIEDSVYENLLTLLNIDEFPQAMNSEKFVKEDGIISDEECCICFALETENGLLPDVICNNNRCNRHFHSICLFQWLQELATNKIVFNKIFGSCPHCGEEISSDVQST